MSVQRSQAIFRPVGGHLPHILVSLDLAVRRAIRWTPKLEAEHKAALREHPSIKLTLVHHVPGEMSRCAFTRQGEFLDAMS